MKNKRVALGEGYIWYFGKDCSDLGLLLYKNLYGRIKVKLKGLSHYRNKDIKIRLILEEINSPEPRNAQEK